MKTNSMWEADQVRKLTTVFAVDQQINRCVLGTKAAPTIPKKKEWQRKIKFLCALKEHVAMNAPESVRDEWKKAGPDHPACAQMVGGVPCTRPNGHAGEHAVKS